MPNRLAILIVEDDPSQLSEYVRRFEERDHRVRSTSSAEEAIRLVQTARFDLILSDNALPGMSGLRSIPELAKWSCAPVFIMTSHHCAEGEKDAALLGAAAYLKKPLDVEDVVLRAWRNCIAFEAVNDTLKEFYVGLCARSLTPQDIASLHKKNPPPTIAHWKNEHRVWYCCVNSSLSGPDSEAFVRAYAERLARPGWKALAG